MKDRVLRIVVLLSGEGATLQALLDASPSLGEIVLVLTDRPDAGGLQRAARVGVPTQLLQRSDFASKALFEQALASAVLACDPDVIVLAGFMRVLGKAVCKAWRGKAINLHPSLLPKYPGLDTHQRALEAGDTVAGASVHWLTAELDGGPVIAQASVPILPTDDARTLADRVKPAEQALLVQVVRGWQL